jgi:hypothetical protein
MRLTTSTISTADVMSARKRAAAAVLADEAALLSTLGCGGA